MQLDLRRPTIVVTGQWNPAVFQPGWIASKLFDHAVGETVKIAQVVAPERPLASYIGDFGIGAANHRVEFYINALEDDGLKRLESLALKVMNLLPHTPMKAIGINFHFTDEEVDPELVDKLRTSEGLETDFEVQSQSLAATMNYHGDVLNLRRDVNASAIEIDFNFHKEPLNAAELVPAFDGALTQNRYQEACNILKKIYGRDVAGILKHDFGNFEVAA